mgnify:CR=1 FL=1
MKSSQGRKSKFIVVILILVIIMVVSSGCMAHRQTQPEKVAGFFTGIWHGWIAPIALIVGLFNKTVTIYEVNNSGWWYDFGYYMAIISGFGGLSITRRSKSKKDD